jgi:D-threo-aldose 1-dehydrogenase
VTVQKAPFDFGKLGVGGASLGNLYRPMDDATATAIVEEGFAQGLHYFDTAPHYGLGLSERRLGRELQKHDRSTYILSTKVGRLVVPNPTPTELDDGGFAVPGDFKREYDASESGIRRSLDESLGRLGLDHVDILYLHDPDEYDLYPALKTALPALEKLRDEGLVTAIGIGTKSIEAAVSAVTQGNLDLVMLSGRYTLLEQPALPELLPLCAEKGVGIVDVSVFNSGLLASATPTRKSHYDYGDVPDDIFARAEALAAKATALGIDLPTAAIQYPLQHPQVYTVVIGSSSPTQVAQNAERMRVDIPAEFWTELKEDGLIPA